MAKNLVIVESPGKVKAIGKYLGKDFLVKASLGHVKDLPKRNLSVDVDNDFKPVYEVIEGKRKLIAELKAAAKTAENIYLAADPDREGEAICFHLQEELESKNVKIFRVMFNEITKTAVQKAFEKPLSVNLHLVDAQQARRILDRLVGYKISPLLWDKVRRGLSAGRVQTVALRLIVEREREIQAFITREYWSIDVSLNAKKAPVLKAHLFKKNDENAEIPNEAAANAIVTALVDVPYVVKSVTNREKKRNPAAPFITSTLQQEGARKCRFSVKRTMMLAQKLYEGVELSKDEGAVGLISYMRTDSVRVSNDALDEVRAMIGDRYGAAYRPASPNIYKGKKDAQDAHEAIRPTSVLRTPEDVAPFLAEDELKVYRLIWMRFVASQMAPAVFDQTTIDIDAAGKDGASYLFRATGSVEKFDGFLKVYEEGKDQKDDEEDEMKKLPAVEKGESLKFKSIDPEQHFTEPPPRFTEATLVKELESDGVGRPSTYASILSTIQDREYVRKDGGKFFPTELGMVVAELLLESFRDLFDVTYTARMEAELDEIEEGKLDWRMAMSEFYERFSKDLDHAATHMTDIKRMEVPTDFVCEKCGKPMVIKWGIHGRFMTCTGYPDFSVKGAEAAIQSLRTDFTKRHDRLQKTEIEKREKRQTRYEKELEDLHLRIGERRISAPQATERLKKIGSSHKADLKKLETDIAKQGKEDLEKLNLRLENLPVRYPHIDKFYQLDLKDMDSFGHRAPYFCGNTRELPDTADANVSEQDEAVMCDNCGRPMVLKKGRFGQFLACSGYPDCKTTKQLGVGQKQQDVPLEEKCPNCGSNMVRKFGRYGDFVACSNYPACKYVKQKTIGVKCPNCSEGEVVERRSKRGKTFYGCNRYPDCDFVAWGKPLPEKCPECGGAYLIEKYLKSGSVAQCPNGECKFKKPLPPPEADAAAPVEEPVGAKV